MESYIRSYIYANSDRVLRETPVSGVTAFHLGSGKLRLGFVGGDSVSFGFGRATQPTGDLNTRQPTPWLPNLSTCEMIADRRRQAA
jgi:hypothetical protein